MTNTTKADINSLVRSMPAISLDEMASVRLMNRTDCKYLTNVPTLIKLLRRAQDCYFSQEVEGERICPYATTYYDERDTLGMFRSHQTGHRPRTKVRVRTYAGSGLTFLEVKKKDNHGRTRKKRVEVDSLEAVMNGHMGEAFLHKLTDYSFDDLEPTLSNRFCRITLVNMAKTERLTIDFDINFFNHANNRQAEMDNIVVIELKRDGRAPSPVLPMLRDLRIKPAGFSKYCIGVSVTSPDLHLGKFKKRLVSIRKVAEGRNPQRLEALTE